MDFDFETIKLGLKEAAGIGDSLGKLTQVASSIQNLVKTPETSREVELKGLIAELTSEIADTKLKNADLKIRLADVLSALSSMQKADVKFQSYNLYTLSNGDFVYRYERTEDDTQPEHFACPECRENDKLSFLTPNDEGLWCTPCKRHFGPGGYGGVFVV
jgi:hypothetical protein